MAPCWVGWPGRGVGWGFIGKEGRRRSCWCLPYLARGWPRPLASHAVGPRTPLRSPSRVVTASRWNCLWEEALQRQNLPESFLSGNLEPAPFMTFSRGGGRGTGWVYSNDTICVMTSAPTRPLSSVNSWKGLGQAQNAGAGLPWGRGLAGVRALFAGSARCPSYRQAGPGMARFLGAMEASTTSCRCPCC